LAKLNDLDPQAWLADVLARIADNQRDRELLPLEMEEGAHADAENGWLPRRVSLRGNESCKFISVYNA
jgi:hypothetical protein